MRASREKLADLWRRARQEHAGPGEIGIAVAIGLLACSTPLLGFHSVIALGLATLLRVNRLWALVFSQASFFGLLRPPIIFTEVELGHRLHEGAWLPLTMADVVARAPSLVADWAIGSLPFAAVVATTGGLLAYAWAARRDARRVRLGTPLPPRTPSSGSTP